jgi:DNA-binding SARP family transcriptional activator/DNA-binding XRE family transcriptional regulator
MDVGAELRRRRQAVALTQRQLAQRTGLSLGAIRDLEQGRARNPHPGTIRRLAEVLGLDAGDSAGLVHEMRARAGSPGGRAGDAGPGRGLRLRVLGNLAVWRSGVAFAPGPPRQRAVLGLLALHPGQAVHRDVIIDALWGEASPASAVDLLHTHVSRLRQLLEPGRRGRDRNGLLRCEGGSYLLELTSNELDLLAFRELAGRGREAARASDHAAACDAYARALALWHGEPLCDVEVLRGHPAVADVVREHQETVLGYAAAAVLAGTPQQTRPSLQALADREPLSERVHAMLMHTLAADGDQAGALEVYDRIRRRLDDELAVRPGALLAEAYSRILHQQIPTANPPLDAAEPPRTLAGYPAAVTPRQLPAPVAHFAGRAKELAALTGLLGRSCEQAPRAIVISAIGGTAGVGKTVLAVHWAHQVADRFGDGQLYVNLRGFDPSGIPVTPEAAIRRFLDALDVPPQRIPPDPDAQAGLYRSLLADRTMLILLDNARDEAQVRPLLPASPHSLVLVTSRSELAGLAAADGTRLLALDVLSHDEAVQLLTARLGTDRVAAEPDAVAEIADLCACLPLALAVAAARAAARPGFSLAALAAELRDAADRLDALDAGDPAASVRAVFSWSYRQLSTDAARMFRLLGVHPGPDISVQAAASLAGIAKPEARRLLRALARAHLTAEHVPGRYAFHDLLRAYAAAQADDTDSEPEAAVGRVLDYYLHSAYRAATLLLPSHEPVALASPSPGAVPEQPADHRQALAWFEAEHQVLLAAVTLADSSGSGSHAWQLPWAIEGFLHVRGHCQEWADTQRTALAAATRLDDTAGQAVSGRLLASACTELGDHDQALSHYASSLRLYQQLGNRLGEAKVHHNLGVLAEHQGRYPDALRHAEQALRLYQAVGHKAAEADALNNVGWYHGLLVDYQQARAYCRRALALCTELSYRRGEGNAWDSLGYAEHQLGNLPEAAACYERALSIARETGDRWGEAEALIHLGDTRHADDDLTQAREAWQKALTILEDIQHPYAAKARAKLGGLDAECSPA